MIAVRAVTAEDLPEIRRWSEDRGLALIDALLSPHGFVALKDGEPVLAAWAYMLLDVPVIQIDQLCGRPGASIQTVRAAWQNIMYVVQEWVKIINETSGLSYNLLRCFCEERMLSEAAKNGWTASRPAYAQITKILP